MHAVVNHRQTIYRETVWKWISIYMDIHIYIYLHTFVKVGNKSVMKLTDKQKQDKKVGSRHNDLGCSWKSTTVLSLIRASGRWFLIHKSLWYVHLFNEDKTAYGCYRNNIHKVKPSNKKNFQNETNKQKKQNLVLMQKVIMDRLHCSIKTFTNHPHAILQSATNIKHYLQSFANLPTQVKTLTNTMKDGNMTLSGILESVAVLY